MSLRVALVNQPLAFLQLLTDAQYVLNSSNVPEYDYKRLLVTDGVNFTF